MGRQEDGQTGCAPLKGAAPLELPAGGTAPVSQLIPAKPALPYRIWHQKQQRGDWLLHEDSNISSLSFPSPLAGGLAVALEASLLF